MQQDIKTKSKYKIHTGIIASMHLKCSCYDYYIFFVYAEQQAGKDSRECIR